MGSKTQKWKMQFEELTLVKENLERKIRWLTEQIRSTANIKGSIGESQKRAERERKDARLDPDNPINVHFARSDEQRRRRGSGRKV